MLCSHRNYETNFMDISQGGQNIDKQMHAHTETAALSVALIPCNPYYVHHTYQHGIEWNVQIILFL